MKERCYFFFYSFFSRCRRSLRCESEDLKLPMCLTKYLNSASLGSKRFCFTPHSLQLQITSDRCVLSWSLCWNVGGKRERLFPADNKSQNALSDSQQLETLYQLSYLFSLEEIASRKTLCSIPCINVNFYLCITQEKRIKLHIYFINNTYIFRSPSVTTFRVYSISNRSTVLLLLILYTQKVVKDVTETCRC